jgi:Nucleoside 2-deoxyribosyltransferase like
MKYIECPEVYYCAGKDKCLFLGGGITNCFDWQTEVVEKLSTSSLTLLNPRRKERFPKGDGDAVKAQIEWEWLHLGRADAITFWFPPEATASMTLYELGAWACRPKKLFVGFHPDFSRKNSLTIQTKLERPYQEIVYSLDDMVKQILEWEGK